MCQLEFSFHLHVMRFSRGEFLHMKNGVSFPFKKYADFTQDLNAIERTQKRTHKL